jgi:RNA polymerase sigma-70 factor (ECF subfamily)
VAHHVPDEASLLFLAHRGRLLRYLTRLTGDRHRGEDAVQEAMLRAYLNADRLWPDERARLAWLFRVARNAAVTEATSLRTQSLIGLADLDENRIHGVACPADRVATRVDVARALRRLSPGQRRVVFEVYYRGRTTAEAAAAIGISLGTAKTQLRHGLRRLRRFLESCPPARA